MREVGASGELGGEESSAAQVQEKAGQAAQQVREKAQPALGQARGKAEELRGQAGSRLREQVDTRSTQAGDRVQSVAEAVRTTSEQLRGQGKEREAKVAEQAADRAERLGGYLRESDADRILGDVEAFARRQPWLIAVAAGALGFLTARFLKASSTGDQAAVGSEGRPSEPSLAPATWEDVAPVTGAPVGTPPAAVDLPAAPVDPSPRGQPPGSRRQS
jgi:ElaB/YqjD/DUF883 family membrane-anchored ribosome-binding protein